jgi:hypothetical protein
VPFFEGLPLQQPAVNMAAGGRVDPIYDPDSLVRLPDGSYSRTQFPNNMIPPSRFDPVAVEFLTLNPFAAPNNRNNQTFFTSQGRQSNASYDTRFESPRTSFNSKIDHQFTDFRKIFGALRRTSGIVRGKAIYNGGWCALPRSQPRSNPAGPEPDHRFRLLDVQSCGH